MKAPEIDTIVYKNPPVTEVALSIQFDQPKNLNLGHLGAFWASQASSFPKVKSAPPINTISESFEIKGQWLPPVFNFAISDEPKLRLQLVSLDDQWVCQIQHNRLAFNWRKKNNDYPGFELIVGRFFDLWKTWNDFLSDQKVPIIIPEFWEITYINRVEKSKAWATIHDWPKVLPGLFGGGFREIDGAKIDGFQGQWVWRSANPPARVYVEPKPDSLSENNHEGAFILSLTARGPISAEPAHENKEMAEQGMLFGHNLILEIFENIISQEASEQWGRK